MARLPGARGCTAGERECRMKTVPHRTLPLSTTSPFTPRGQHPVVDSRAWTRAVAQALYGAALGNDGAPSPMASRAPQAVPTAPDGRAGMDAPRIASLAAAGCSHQHSGAMPASIAMSKQAHGHSQHPVCEARAPTGAPAAAPDEAAPTKPSQTSRAPRRAPASQPPVRVHVEQQAHGLAIWLGVDRSVAPASLGPLLAQLRWPAGAGPHIVALTCNGTPLHPRSSSEREIP